MVAGLKSIAPSSGFAKYLKLRFYLKMQNNKILFNRVNRIFRILLFSLTSQKKVRLSNPPYGGKKLITHCTYVFYIKLT
jgi:hypothetical protein